MRTSVFVLALHVLAGFVAVAFLVVPGLILEIVAHTRDVVLIRKTYALASFHGKVGGPFAILVPVLGVAAAMLNGRKVTGAGIFFVLSAGSARWPMAQRKRSAS